VQIIDGRPVYAATDLVGFLACEHLTGLERAAMAKLTTRPERIDPELDIIRRRGTEHEQRYLGELRTAGKAVVEIELDGSIEDRGDQLRAAAAATEAAMAAGPDVIYQATFFDGTWRGHADFLLRVESPDRPSRWGPYHYEVADTKLARHVKASAVLQLCSYVEQLARVQGVQPEWMYVALGGSARAIERLRVDDYMAYYRASRDRFLAAMESEPAFPPVGTYPDPVDHCDVCRWAVECAARRRDDDHLSLVANISGRQRRALEERSITTLEQLGQLGLPLDPALEGVGEAALQRVRDQARIQLEGRVEQRMKYELLLPAPGQPIDVERGLATLPPPSPADLFFDIEGDPYAFEDGLDYLFGVRETDATFHAFWSREPDGTFTLDAERRAFEQLMDFIIERLDRDPTLHVYHYAPYEPTALKRLMGRYATRENEVDRLLRGGVMVDLLRAVRQSLRASVESYSIKKIEPLYEFERTIDLRDAGSSIVAFEEWLELADSDRPAATHLDRIQRYNEDDVRSNAALRDWLEKLRLELEAKTGVPVPRPSVRQGELPAELTEAQAHNQSVAAALSAVPTDPSERTAEEQAAWLLGQLLGWHRREDKSMWWDFFRLMLESTLEDLVGESDAIARLVPAGPLDDPVRGKQLWRYGFPAQDFDVGRGDVFDPGKARANRDASPFSWVAGEIVAIDAAARTLDLKRSVTDDHPEAVVSLSYVPSRAQQARLLTIGEWVRDNGIAHEGPYRAARDLLLRALPRAGSVAGGSLRSLRRPNETDLGAARRLAVALDASTLPIQGPPGSGKTWTGARMICSLLAAGKRVGITANSHKVIGNLLQEVLRAAPGEGVEVRAVQRGDKDDVVADDRVIRGKDNAHTRGLVDAGANLIAGTAWLWSSDKMIDAIDVLFVDEAAQMSLANAVSITPSTRSLVLLGDPQQLEQPLRGSHPPGAEKSALGHVLGGDATMPPERGLFLERTHRLHPQLSAYTSEVFYETRLEPHPGLERQRVDSRSALDGVGLRFMPRVAVGFDNESPPEAELVADLARSLVTGGSTWTDEHGTVRAITWEDLVIVAPYNAQVGAIARLLPPVARVGTVDKFQGQQAPVSIYSMTTSSPELAPRGMNFLYSRNRLNVATSRARSIAVVVASPDLLRVRARTPEQMRLANALARFVEMASGPRSGRDANRVVDEPGRPMVLFPYLVRPT
jgi:predicted RecB family nuclease